MALGTLEKNASPKTSQLPSGSTRPKYPAENMPDGVGEDGEMYEGQAPLSTSSEQETEAGDAAEGEAGEDGESQGGAQEGPSTAEWVLLFVAASGVDLIGAIPIVNLIRVPSVYLFKKLMKAFGVPDSKILTIAAWVFGVGSIAPIPEPSCTGMVFTGWVLQQTGKTLAKVAPAAKIVKKVAGVVKYAIPEAAIVEGVAGGVERAGEGVKRGESVEKAVGSGAVEGAKTVGSGMTGGAAGGAAGAAGAGQAAGVGEQYGVGKVAAEKRASPVRAQIPGGSEDDDGEALQAEVARRAELDSPYADLPEEMTEGPISGSVEGGDQNDRFGGKVTSAADYLARQKKRERKAEKA